jgi:hypothetical protein
MENKKLKYFLWGFLITTLLWCTIFGNIIGKLKAPETKTTELDSLKAEIFVKQLEVQRYEYVLDQLDSSCKQMADSVMSNTE